MNKSTKSKPVEQKSPYYSEAAHRYVDANPAINDTRCGEAFALMRTFDDGYKAGYEQGRVDVEAHEEQGSKKVVLFYFGVMVLVIVLRLAVPGLFVRWY